MEALVGLRAKTHEGSLLGGDVSFLCKEATTERAFRGAVVQRGDERLMCLHDSPNHCGNGNLWLEFMERGIRNDSEC